MRAKWPIPRSRPAGRAAGTGTIIIELTELAGATAVLLFSLSNGETGTDFTLRDGESLRFEDMPAGAHIAQEGPLTDALEGFDLGDITCVEDGTANSVAEVGNRRALINLEPNETVTCTFTGPRVTSASSPGRPGAP